MTSPKPRIAIIGGGAAGLSAARVASRNGWDPRVFEKDLEIGGVWRYRPRSQDRPMYAGLRTNLPKEIMGFRELPWTTEDSGVEASYVTHRDVQEYLKRYKDHFGLSKYITFGSTVKQMTMLVDKADSPAYVDSKASVGSEKLPSIKLEWEESLQAEDDSDPACKSEVFDAVFVCNGHYAKPSFPFLQGLGENFRGNVMHSISYDDPKVFEGQTVLCIGGRASGADLAREISMHANHVYLSDTTCTSSNSETRGNVTWVPKTLKVEEDGSIQFDYDYVVKDKVDTIIFCTGYDYEFPFINEKSNIELSVVPGERRVTPLYEQLWHANFPNVAFVGLPHSVLPFPLFELQAEATYAVWSGHASAEFPELDQRLAQAARDATSGGAKGDEGRIQDTHYLGSMQWDYCQRLATYAGLDDDAMRAYIATNKGIYDHAGKTRKDCFPGGEDLYREYRYTRNDQDVAFEIEPPAVVVEGKNELRPVEMF